MIKTSATKAADGKWLTVGWVAGFDIQQGQGFSVFTTTRGI
jgi:hypothetical protein